MSNNIIELKTTNNSNGCIDLIEEAITKNDFKHYEYNHFSNIQEICSKDFGKVYRANWKNTHRYFALKSMLNLDHITIEEIVNEVITK